MDDAARANIFRKPEGANTTEGWNALREAVKGVKDDIQATNIDKIGHQGKWTIRYANGDQPHNEADCTFMSCARNTVLSMMDKIESLYQANAILCDLADGCDNEIPRLRAEIEALSKEHADLHTQYDGELQARDAEIETLKGELAKVPLTVPKSEEQPAEVTSHLTEAPKANMDEAKPKRKRMTKTEAAEILDITPAPATAESGPTDEA